MHQTEYCLPQVLSTFPLPLLYLPFWLHQNFAFNLDWRLHCKHSQRFQVQRFPPQVPWHDAHHSNWFPAMLFLTHVPLYESHELERLPVPLFPEHMIFLIKEVAAGRPMSMAHSTLMLVAVEWSCSSPRWENLPSGHQRYPLFGINLGYMYWGQKHVSE